MFFTHIEETLVIGQRRFSGIIKQRKFGGNTHREDPHI
jgi:hypothetical protein